MAYGKAYTIQAVAKTEPNETVYTCEIWEKDFVGYEDTFDAAAHPFTAQILASSDDPFDPILASTLTLLIDITNFTGTLPDFTSNDDHKYWVKLYNSGTTYYAWQWYMLMDSVNVHFSTGVLFLQCLCTDGIALLKSIPYVASSDDINVEEDLSTVITNCLNKIDFPDGYYVNYVCGIYATGMDTSISVFKQSYYPIRNWLNSAPVPPTDGSEPVSPFMSCYDVLQKIVFSFGARIFQSYGQFWIANVNEQGNDGVRIFQTTNANGSETVSTRNTVREIVPYTNTTDSPWYFQDNIQTKILRKGYPKIELNHTIGFSPQCIDNGCFERVTAGAPDNWTLDTSHSGGLGTITQFTYDQFYGFALYAGTNYVTMQPNSVARIYGGDRINLSFILQNSSVIANTPGIQVELKIDVGGGHQWKYKFDAGYENPVWVYDFVDGWYNVTVNDTQYDTKSINTLAAPASGILSVIFRIQVATTSSDAFIANVRLTFDTWYDRQVVLSKVNSLSNYKKTVEIPLGAQSNNDYSEVGSLNDSSGAILTGWYRYGITESYTNLMRLIAQQYTNLQAQSVINFDLTLRNLLDLRSTTLPRRLPHVIGTMDNVQVQDTTATTLSVNGKYYIMGASTFDYTEDIQTGTMLETTSTDVTSTFTDNLILKK